MLTNSFNEKINIYWRRVDKKILFSFMFLFFLGLFFSFSSTSSLAGERLDKDYYFFFSKHLLFVIIALLVMIFISFLDLNIVKKSVLPIFIILFMLLFMVPFIGVEVKGSKRWLDLFFFSLTTYRVSKTFFHSIGVSDFNY